MRFLLKKIVTNVVLRHIAFCIVVSDLHGALNQKNNRSFDFSLKAILLHFFRSVNLEVVMVF